VKVPIEDFSPCILGKGKPMHLPGRLELYVTEKAGLLFRPVWLVPQFEAAQHKVSP